MRTKIFLGSALVLALLLAGVGATLVLAQGPTPTPGTTPRANMGQLFLQALANKLGISVPTLQQDFADARKDAINQAVKQGLITQAQADRMLQRLQNVPPAVGIPGSRVAPKSGAARGFVKGEIRGFLGADVLEAAAGALNMKPADVTTALRSGKTLADLAKQQNVDASKVQTAIVNAEKAAIDRASQDGLITEDRANTLKSNLDPNKIDLSRPFLGQRGPQKR